MHNLFLLAVFAVASLLFFANVSFKMAASITARIVYVTVPSEIVARNISRSIVQSKLAACVNIVPGITSIYEWENKVEESSELLLIIKTRHEVIEDLKKEVHKLHPYDVPEFISLPIEDGSDPYLQWIQKQTTMKE